MTDVMLAAADGKLLKAVFHMCIHVSFLMQRSVWACLSQPADGKEAKEGEDSAAPGVDEAAEDHVETWQRPLEIFPAELASLAEGLADVLRQASPDIIAALLTIAVCQTRLSQVDLCARINAFAQPLNVVPSVISKLVNCRSAPKCGDTIAYLRRWTLQAQQELQVAAEAKTADMLHAAREAEAKSSGSSSGSAGAAGSTASQPARASSRVAKPSIKGAGLKS